MPRNGRIRKRCKAAGTYGRAFKTKKSVLERRDLLPTIISDLVLPPASRITIARPSTQDTPPVPSPDAAVPLRVQDEDKGHTQRVTENCTITTYYEGDAASAVDEHFRRSLARYEISSSQSTLVDEQRLAEVSEPSPEPLLLPPVTSTPPIPPPPPVIEFLDTSTARRVEHGALERTYPFDLGYPLIPPLYPPVDIDEEGTGLDWLDALLDLDALY